MNYKEKFKELGVLVPELVIPNRRLDLSKFACIACDQYNAEPKYWDEVKEYVGKEPSSLYFIMPEAWLAKNGQPDSEEHQNHQDLLAANMKFFLVDGSLDELDPGMMYVKRTIKNGKLRRGLVLAIDLERYEYTEGNKALIRATEKTVKERIPARAVIRSKAPLECPHIMLLYADKDNKLNNLLDEISGNNPFYDFDLMKGAGHLTGYFISEEEKLEKIADTLLDLKAKAEDGMLFAVGDGNHSLAAAKAHWDKIKKFIPEDQRNDHPARFALVELINLYDESMIFEPIHRIVKNIDPEDVKKVIGEGPYDLQALQPKLDEYLEAHPEAMIDYIHGAETAKKLEAEDPSHSLAIVFDSFDRDSLFKDVIKNGSLVRKSFSMGIADDKRFYFESRRITKINKEHIVPNASWNL